MNIRTKLFIFIPLLVILMNLVSFFIFDSSKRVQESYNLMMDRILLYKQISYETEENLRYLNRYLIRLDMDSYPEFIGHMEALRTLKQELMNQETNETNHLQIKNLNNMIDTFLGQVQQTIASVNQKGFHSNALSYYEAEKSARFIREHGQTLVDMELSYYQPIYQEIMKTTARMNLLGVWLFFTTTLLSIVFAIWISRSITNPIRRLVTVAKRISKGDLQTKAPEIQSGDEIGILCRSFNQMLDNLQQLMLQNMESLEKDRLVKEFELKSLQSQINPHFLFNTLNGIAKLAYIEGAEQTSELTISVSKLLRYNLQKLDQPVTLRDEVEHAQEYFAIQKARFRDRVEMITEIDERALNQSIPCLTLQPILENAFVHGIDEIEEGAVLRLKIEYEEPFVKVEISDNGTGMTEEMRQKLLDSDTDQLSRPSKGHSTGLGTLNVFKRLHLFFDGEEQIDIKSERNQGTTVIFRLPQKTNTA
ncbi:sensor histidine kinase [Brevibacillus migulae]|uniref:sensor histidine kinase n=1 Tax=Brevibacillus migulae TaxID=1644114 RepID=UPI00106E2120|nr:histidine kinase [Brevibacillus migulae]